MRMLAKLARAFFRSIHRRSPVRSLTFTPGQVITGEVVRHLNEREVIVRINDRTLRAITEVPLSKRAQYSFQVQSRRGRILLKVMTNHGGHGVDIENASTLGKGMDIRI